MLNWSFAFVLWAVLFRDEILELVGAGGCTA